MRTLLDLILKRFVVLGRLTVRWPDGSITSYTGEPGAEAVVEIRDDRSVRRLALNPALAVGEAYMDGGLAPVGCTIYDVLEVLMSNQSAQKGGNPIVEIREAVGVATRRIAQFNPAHRSRRNVAHHYDLNGRLYSLFLDRDRQYSCGYFPRGDETIDEAQIAKKRHIAAKLLLDRPGLSVLDIGCGWGGLALTLARDYGARVTGITLSTEQLAEAQARAKAEGLDDRVNFELMDYRSMHRSFDRIVSVGMFEHVGVNHYRQFFDVVKRCLAPDGVALLHSIGRSDKPSATNPWISKYIFPGGYCPSLSEVLPAIEKTGLIATDIEILRLHYAETLRHWRRRFMANLDAICTIYDERFCRMFEFYLAGSELAFRYQHQMIFQIQLTRQQAAAPLARDYITDAERAFAARAKVDA
jgi:cyclopropane-fatty-acyl-phospholipid synthase